MIFSSRPSSSFIVLIAVFSIMPDNRETRASGLVAENGFRIAQAADADLTLEHLVCDASSAEAEARCFGKSKTGASLCYGRFFDCFAWQQEPPNTRVSHTHEATCSHLSANSVSTVLSKFSPSWRAVDPSHLDFELANSVFDGKQNSSIPTWDTGIMSVLKDPTWEDHVADFSIPPNIYTATSDFLLLVSNWIKKENFLAGRKHVLACNAIRSANKVWYGIGVYTVMELFFMAVRPGLPDFLRHSTLISIMGSNLWALLRPCIHEGVLAPTTEQRLRYMDWLYVWAKDRVFMSRRMSQLLDDFHLFIQQFSQDVLGKFASDESTTCRGDVDDLYDVFEPTLVEPALQAHPNFGSLIFDPHLLIVDRRRCGLLLGTSLQVCTGVVYQRQIITLDAGYLRVCGAKEDEDKDCADASPVKPKKRRLSADQKLALHSHQN
ncbi:hypothetical protein B0H10DRAFT_1966270 [Mycena sp. CBHHK59/15]|nr:hypothetical protein B0H10DRAFT_1966270 [Mycena sp. CBHHK59/15]